MSASGIDGSYLTPRWEQARVADAMRHGILSCSAASSLREAARTMSLHHVHTIVVTDPADDAPVGLLSDASLLSAMLQPGAADRVLADVADPNIDTISSDELLTVAAGLMRDHATAHLVVRDPHSGRPNGMLSTLDLAGILAWGEA